jgi:hypothetical protein
MDFVPLADIQDDPDAIVARLLSVAAANGGTGEDDDQDATAGLEGVQGDAKPLPWHVRASRRLFGDQAVWDDQGS